METVRLKKIRQPSQVERLLERLVTQAGLVPTGAYQLRDRSGLPSALQRVLIQMDSKERVWTCWTDSCRIWLFTAEMSQGWLGSFGQISGRDKWTSLLS